MKFEDILVKFHQLENDELVFTNDDERAEFEKMLSVSIKKETDFWVDYLKYLETRSVAAKETSDKYAKKAVTLMKQFKYLKGCIAKDMDTFGWKSIKGKEHELTLVSRNLFKHKILANAELAAKYPDLIQVETDTWYSWDTDKLRAQFEKDPTLYESIAGFEKSIYVKY